jgi:hypothetical protein
MIEERRWMFVLAAALAGVAASSCGGHTFNSSTGGGGSGQGGSGHGGSGAAAATCGNGVKEGEEPCDGSDLGGATCASIKGAGYFLPPGKALVCKGDCTLDTSACSNACALDVPGSLLDACAIQ